MTTDPDTTIPQVACAGSPYEIGLGQGRAARELVRDSASLLSGLDAFRLSKPPLLPFALFRWLAARRAAALWRHRLDAAVPEMAERIQGLAAGSGASLRTLQLMNVLEPMMSDLRERTELPPPGGCSAIAVTGARSATGAAILARNFDYLKLVQPFYLLRETRPEGGLRSLDFTAAPLAGTIDGMNEAGLCITNNYAYVVDPPQPDRTVTMLVSEVLASCRTVAEAADLITRRPRWGGALLMLADARGDIASLEISNGRAQLRRPDGDSGLLHHTNRFRDPRMREVELDADACYSDRAPEPLRGARVHRSSDRRDARLDELVAQHTAIGPDELVQILSDHGREGVPSGESVCMHSSYWFTTATLQLLPQSRRVRVAFDSTCQARFVELSLEG